MTNHFFGSNGWGRAFEDEGAGSEGAELDGLRIVFDQKVGLHPANLQKTVGQPAPKRPARLGAGMLSHRAGYGLR
jgi:hypothetical protein